ncbi:unnamed protein product [Alopecurus aequalis]
MAGGDPSTGAEVDAGFEFAFDNEAFSDRELLVEVVGSADAPGSGAGRKRLREEAEGTVYRSCKGVLRVRTINVSSVILAAKSSFFFKLFSNGMKESGQRKATVRIADSEENAFKELLHFMYSGKLTPTTDPTLLVDILMAADKFEAVSCMNLCCQRLIAMPMTLESAVMCLDLRSSISMAADLAEAAKKFLYERYRFFLTTKFQDDLMRIPLPGIVAILSRYDLRVASEVAIYDFVLRWAFSQYPSSEERCNILSSRLLPLVPLMRLKNNVTVVDKQNFLIDFGLDREQCSRLFPSRSEYLQKFRFAGHVFSLSARCNMDSYHCFGLLIEMLEDKGPVKGTIDYKFEATTAPWHKGVTMYECTSTDSREAVECKDLYGIPWSEFIADDSPSFIGNFLNLKIHMKMTPKPV